MYEKIIKVIRTAGVKDGDSLVRFLVKEAARENPVDPLERTEVNGARRFFCPECEAVVGTSYRYCCKCGQKLDWRYMR